MTETERRDTFLDGLNAYRRGIPRRDNPHGLNFDLWFEWALGWDSGRDSDLGPQAA